MTSPSTGNLGPIEGEAATDAPKKRSTTTWAVDGELAPRAPNERDESSDSGSGAPSDVMRRAHDDVQEGKKPTDKGEATEAVYSGSLRGPTPGRERDEGGA